MTRWASLALAILAAARPCTAQQPVADIAPLKRAGEERADLQQVSTVLPPADHMSLAPQVEAQSADPDKTAGIDSQVQPQAPIPPAADTLTGAAIPTLAAAGATEAARDARRFEEHQGALEGLARAYPDWVEIRGLGRSRGGREISVAVIGDARGAAADLRPALFVCADLPRSPARLSSGRFEDPPARGPTAVLGLIEDLLGRAASDPEIAALLRRATIYVVSAPDPDRWFGVSLELGPTLPRDVDLDRNFPVDWRPVGRGGGPCGPYPLSESESRALARFVQSRTNVSALLLCPTGAPELLPHADEASKIPLASESARALPLDGARLPAGSFARFCAELAGTSVFDGGASAPQSASLAAGASSEPITSILRNLPRLVVGAALVERLRTDLWVVDVPLENHGSLPTASARIRARWSGPSVWLKATGARVVSVAAEEPGRAGLRPLDARPDAWFLADLPGGARSNLRLVVQAEENATLEIAVESLRAGVARASVPLR